jgi:hypothetical protein
MIQRGLPQAFVDALMARYARGVGPAETVTGEVERILGRPARTPSGSPTMPRPPVGPVSV